MPLVTTIRDEILAFLWMCAATVICLFIVIPLCWIFKVDLEMNDD